MGGHASKSSGRLRLGLLGLLAAAFVLVPAASASAVSYTLTVNVEGEGLVWCEAEYEVAGEPEVTSDECEEEQKYPAGAEVTLEPIELGDEFKEFTGDCDVFGFEECGLTMDKNREVTAIFEPEPVNEYVLSISTAGTGSGEVECELEEVGLEPCEAEYPEETEVTLVPVAAKGSEFVKWEEDCAGEPEECNLEMDEDHIVTAVFNLVEGGGGEGEPEGSGGTGGGDGTTEPPPPTPTPTTVLPGRLHVGGAALYKGGKAMLRLTCRGRGPCEGRLKLFAKLRRGKGKAMRAQIGMARFRLPAGRSVTRRVRLSRPARRLLRRGRTLKAKAGGPGVARSRLRIKATAR